MFELSDEGEETFRVHFQAQNSANTGESESQKVPILLIFIYAGNLYTTHK